ncbi:MAG: cell division protein ZapA [Ruminococcaceae bacterium]|nr:cell division protein ZapA [Oscillospiraceae bacterium]MBO4972301.1 cell division protein ZapA [Clostridia bacterium]MBQ1259495.1 cell division protein ZapA [Clostridia bacterium]
MNNKYTLNIDGISLCVRTDESEASVSEVANMLSRRIRAIHTASPNCSRTEAALICALECCSDYKKVLDERDSALREIESLRRTIEILKS